MMKKIAVIEDSRALSTLFRTYLEDSEFEAFMFASSPEDIERLASRDDFELIVCPCFPKSQDGPKIARNIKSNPALAHTPLVVSTSMQQDYVRSEWDLRDINAILLKPFDREKLLKTLTKAVHSTPRTNRETPLALVIDDSRAVRNTLTLYLQELNFKVSTASDGEKGLKTASEIMPDLILVDVEMPVLDGFEFCRKLSEKPDIKDIPVIVISGTINESQFRKGFKAGAIDFLEKPVSKDTLEAIIESVSINNITNASGTTVILSQDATLSSILVKTLNFLNSSVNTCSTLDELETFLCFSHPDIVLLDLSRSEDKLNICLQVKNLVKSSSTVIIAVFDETDRDIMFQCFRYGATEFIVKPFGRDEVRARIENHIKLKKLQDELVKKNSILETLAYKDKLTGLMNRRYFDKALKDEIEKAKSTATNLSFLMIDLDNFKQVNDTYGHDTGDIVLKEIAALVMDNIPSSAIACRYGGEEFCVIYPDSSMENALENSEKIKHYCRAKPLSKHRITQTISGGIAAFPETSSQDSLVADADTSLYKAKQSGKNQIQIHTKL